MQFTEFLKNNYNDLKNIELTCNGLIKHKYKGSLYSLGWKDYKRYTCNFVLDTNKDLSEKQAFAIGDALTEYLNNYFKNIGLDEEISISITIKMNSRLSYILNYMYILPKEHKYKNIINNKDYQMLDNILNESANFVWLTRKSNTDNLLKDIYEKKDIRIALCYGEEDEIEAFYFTVEYDYDDSPFIVFINHGNAKEPIKNTNAAVDFLHNIYETELKDSVNKNSIEYICKIFEGKR